MTPIVYRNHPVSDELGSAHFFAEATASPAPWMIRVTADSPRYRSCTRPINVSVASDDHRTSLALSTSEAEALIECLSHALALRRSAETARVA